MRPIGGPNPTYWCGEDSQSAVRIEEPLLTKLIDRPGWRNWQTQRTQNPPRATSWGFDPPSRHQDNKRLIRKCPTRRVGHFHFVAVLVAVRFSRFGFSETGG